MTGRVNAIFRRLYRAPVFLFRWRCGHLLGYRFLLLNDVGRRTGLQRDTVLEVMQYDPASREAIVMSAYGPGADWLRNIQASPEPQVTIGRERFIATFRMLDADEAARVVFGYERRNRYAAPIIRTVLSRFVGWRYRGSPDDRRRLVAQLPLIALRPRA